MNGILIINKPKDYTSHDIVAIIKKIVGEKVGHTGTLDPMAQGVLPLLIGKGTLCSKDLINHDKIYQVELTLGKKTDTADAEGKVIQEQEVPQKVWEETQIKSVFQNIIGKQQQIPPMYSAIKVNGKKLYEYARKAQMVEIQPRQIEIYNIQIKETKPKENKINFIISCSKGTYIRSICETIAEKLGTIGLMSNLIRLQVGDFSLAQAISLPEIKHYQDDTQWLENQIITIEQLYQNRPKINLSKKQLIHFLNGVKLTQEDEEGSYRIYRENQFIGIGRVKDNLLKRDIIL